MPTKANGSKVVAIIIIVLIAVAIAAVGAYMIMGNGTQTTAAKKNDAATTPPNTTPQPPITPAITPPVAPAQTNPIATGPILTEKVYVISASGASSAVAQIYDKSAGTTIAIGQNGINIAVIGSQGELVSNETFDTNTNEKESTRLSRTIGSLCDSRNFKRIIVYTNHDGYNYLFAAARTKLMSYGLAQINSIRYGVAYIGIITPNFAESSDMVGDESGNGLVKEIKVSLA